MSFDDDATERGMCGIVLGDDHTPEREIVDIAKAMGMTRQGAHVALDQALTSFRLAWSQRETIFLMQDRGHLVELIKGGDLACRRCLRNLTDGEAGCCVYPRGTAQRPRGVQLGTALLSYGTDDNLRRLAKWLKLRLRKNESRRDLIERIRLAIVVAKWPTPKGRP